MPKPAIVLWMYEDGDCKVCDENGNELQPDGGATVDHRGWVKAQTRGHPHLELNAVEYWKGSPICVKIGGHVY